MMQHPQRASADKVCGGIMQSLSSEQLQETESCSSSVSYADENSYYTLDSEEGQGGWADDLEHDDEARGLWLSSASLMSSLSGLTTASPLTMAASSSSLNVSMLFAPKSSCASSRTSVDRVSRVPRRRWTLNSYQDFEIKTQDLMTTDDIEQDRHLGVMISDVQASSPRTSAVPRRRTNDSTDKSVTLCLYGLNNPDDLEQDCHLVTKNIYQRCQTVRISNISKKAQQEFFFLRHPDPSGSNRLEWIKNASTLRGCNIQDLSSDQLRDDDGCSTYVGDLEQDDEARGLWLSSASLMSSLTWSYASQLTLEATYSSLNSSLDLFEKSSCANSQASFDRVSRVPRRRTLDGSENFMTKTRDSMTTDHLGQDRKLNIGLDQSFLTHSKC